MQSAITTLPLLTIDLVVTSLSLAVACYLANLVYGRPFDVLIWKQLPPLLMFQVGLMWLHQMYPGAGVSRVHELRAVCRSTALSLGCLSAINVLFAELPRLEFLTFVGAGAFAIVSLPLARYMARYWLARQPWWGIRMLLIGQPDDCAEVLRRRAAYRSSGYIVAGSRYVSEDQRTDDEAATAAITVDAFQRGCLHRAPVAALVSANVQHLTNRLMFQFPTVVSVDQPTGSDLNAEAAELLGLLTMHTHLPLLRTTPRILKRGLDLAVTIPALMLLAIPMAVIAITIKVRSRGPVLFGPVRVGQHGKEFRSWKFRTMVVNAEEVLQQKLASDPEARRQWEQDVKLKDDPRIIPGIGHLLRQWSLDELPQLWNVLRGEMSLVGPRPIANYEIQRYQRHYYDYTQMLPGISGLWQVSGRSDTSYESRVEMVHRYATKWSIWLDVWILAKTPLVVLTKRGAC